jgi:hypothetical protein
MITKEKLHELFSYRQDGNLVRIKSVRGKDNIVGKVIGHLDATGYMHTKVNGRFFRLHRLIYLYHHGYLPEQVDHINRNCLDNRIENLRPANTQQNSSNRKIFTSNTSGCKGVYWHKINKKWFVYVDVDKKRKNIGYFDDLELADLVAIEARDKYHGAYANHI